MAHAEKVYKVRNGQRTKQFTWRARYMRPDGTVGSEPGFPTKKIAVDWGEQQEAAIRAGRWVDPQLQQTSFGDFARTFMASRQKRGNTTSKRWQHLETHILPRWESTPIAAITWFDADSWQQTMSCDDVTRGHCVSLMSTILTAAVDAGLRSVNPLYGRRRTKASGAELTARPKKVVGDGGYVRPELVIQLAQRLGPASGLHVLATAFTGMRWGEGIGLHRDNVLLTRRQEWDGGVFECPIVRVMQEVAEYEERDRETGEKLGTFLGLEPTKNDGSTRDIDLPPFLADLLRQHLDVWPHEFVFCTASGVWWRRGNWGRRLRPAADGRPARERQRGVSSRAAWGPVAPGLDMRSLRHTHDTYQSQIGVKEPLAFEAAGHKRQGMKAIYQHPTPEMRRERLDGLERIFRRAMSNLGLATVWDDGAPLKSPQTITPETDGNS